MEETTNPTVLETDRLGKRYGRRWALSECTLSIPTGRVVGLVGPNGAGKTTLLHLAAGLATPSAGSVLVLGAPPGQSRSQLGRVGIVAQDTPLYARLTVAEHVQMGAWLNPSWDDELARSRITALGLDPRQRAGSLSGGQRAQLALTLAVAKRPRVLLLDEPVASLDPLARREFLDDLMEVVGVQAVSVVLSSHLLSDVERVCDYLIVLAGSRVQVTGDVDRLLASHFRLSGIAPGLTHLPAGLELVAQARTGPQTTLFVRGGPPPTDPVWTVESVELDELVLAYMSEARNRQTHPLPES